MANLAAVLYPAPEQMGFEAWTHDNYQHHLAIETALLEVRGVIATPFRIWPVKTMKEWEGQHQQSHDLFAQELGIDGFDFTGLDLEDKQKKDSWMFRHFMQHLAAAQVLRLDIL